VGDATCHEAEGVHFLVLKQARGHALAQRSDVEIVGALHAVTDGGKRSEVDAGDGSPSNQEQDVVGRRGAPGGERQSPWTVVPGLIVE
jgi:hypothetical protein